MSKPNLSRVVERVCCLLVHFGDGFHPMGRDVGMRHAEHHGHLLGDARQGTPHQRFALDLLVE